MFISHSAYLLKSVGVEFVVQDKSIREHTGTLRAEQKVYIVGR